MTKPRRRPSAPKMPRVAESSLGRTIAKYLDLALPRGSVFTHVPNGKKRDRITGAMLKAEGVRRGVPDYIVVVPGVGTIWAELKTRDGVLSDEQIAWGQALEHAPGVTYGLIYGAEDLERLLRRAGVALRTSLIGAGR